MRATLPIALITFSLVACTGRDAATDTAAAATTAPPVPATVAPPASAATMPAPATTPASPATATTPASPATVATPAPGGVMPAEGAVTFLGFGPAHWGASEEQVRQAWGKQLAGAPSEPNGCYYLFPESLEKSGYRFAFMLEGGKFSRIDVRTADFAAPGGGKVGMDKAALHKLYAGMTEHKDKYDENALNLRAMDPQGGAGVIVFDVDASGKATAWRVGVPPQVDYVEGCS